MNREQSDAWNGPESAHYVDHADRYDAQLAPFTDALLDHARIATGHAVLDIGCGSGATTIRSSQIAGRVVGADLSVPLLAIAEERARVAAAVNTEFVVADAQTHSFGDGVVDRVISQFGVMFFDDPVAAFTNLRRSLTSEGRLAFVCWQPLAVNEWLMLVGRAVTEHAELPRLGGRAGGAGMFALQDPAEIAELLAESGFTRIEVEPCTPTVVIGGGGTVDESVEFLLGTGIVRGLLERVPAEARDRATAEIRDRMVQHHEPGIGVRVGASGWLVAAHS